MTHAVTELPDVPITENEVGVEIIFLDPDEPPVVEYPTVIRIAYPPPASLSQF